jgi:hypothetical protein
MTNPNSGMWNIEVKGNRFQMLLGIHIGQFNEPLLIEKIQGEKFNEQVNAGDTIRIPSSMTTVVPADEILALIDLPFFENERVRRERA